MPNESRLTALLASLCVDVTYEQSLRNGRRPRATGSPSAFWTDVLALDFADTPATEARQHEGRLLYYD